MVEQKQDPYKMICMGSGNDGISFVAHEEQEQQQSEQAQGITQDNSQENTNEQDNRSVDEVDNSGHSHMMQGGSGHGSVQGHSGSHGWHVGPPQHYQCGATGHITT